MKRTEDLYPHVLGHKSTIDATYCIAKMAIELDVPGDFCECGVYAGAQSAAMARAITDSWNEDETRSLYCFSEMKRVHLFDSFQGFPPLGEHDTDLKAASTRAGNSACSRGDVETNMRNWGIPSELLVYHEGWFEDTMPHCYDAPAALIMAADPNTAIKSIAVLRLDADLYESTRVCLKYLYPLVSPGGWVVIDDWNLNGCRKAVDEVAQSAAPIYFRRPQ